MFEVELSNIVVILNFLRGGNVKYSNGHYGLFVLFAVWR